MYLLGRKDKRTQGRREECSRSLHDNRINIFDLKEKKKEKRLEKRKAGDRPILIGQSKQLYEK